MPRVLDPEQTENIMKLLRANFKVLYRRQGHYQDKTGFVPGHGVYTRDASGRQWSDEEIAIEVGCDTGSVAYIRQKQFGITRVKGSTAPQPEKTPKPPKKTFAYPGASSPTDTDGPTVTLETSSIVMLTTVLTRLVESNERVERQLSAFTTSIKTVISMAEMMDMATKPTGDERLDHL